MKEYFLFFFVAGLILVEAGCKKQITVVSPTTKYSMETKSRPADATTSAVTTSTLTAEKTIQFSGYTWIVKPNTSAAGPGPNSWSTDNVWVDDQGKLHLKLTKDSLTGKWNCAEVHTNTTFGYGKYQFQVEGRVDQLDKNVVFGLFNYSGNDGHDEMDIEFSRWGTDINPALNYTVWPKAKSDAAIWTDTRNFLLNGSYSTHRFTRTKSTVKFQSLHGFQNDNTFEFATSTCTDGSIISTLQMPVYINLWLFNSRAPSNDTPVELVVNNFTYTKQ